MIIGGQATIYVSDINVAVQFYAHRLGLSLVDRIGNDLAIVETGNGLRIELMPHSPSAQRPGTSGAITLGFRVAMPLEKAIEVLRDRGVFFRGGIVEDGMHRLAFFGDPDGNDLYLTEVIKP
jgi:catechol 2,3-dioxygenase-like lactoylglutathione lyase family enzyme